MTKLLVKDLQNLKGRRNITKVKALDYFSKLLKIPTIGIVSGPGCDGQFLHS